jgi:uncharacterized protein (TIGR00255 family)
LGEASLDGLRHGRGPAALCLLASLFGRRDKCFSVRGEERGERTLIKSMTGYGRGESTAAGNRFVAEIKTVNNRYRELIVRTPKTLQAVEEDVRALLSERIKRGRVETTLQMIKEGEEPEYELELNLPLVRSYMRIFRRLGEEFGLDEKARAEDLCRTKDVLLIKSEEVDPEQARAAFLEALRLALDSCDLMRTKEGEAIEQDFLKRIALIEDSIEDIEQRAPMVAQEYAKRLRQRIEQMLQGVEIEEARIIQEVAIFADRSDITEELVRAGSHLDQFRSIMSQDDAVGRKLEFLLQELHREINTMSAKASDSAISSKTVEIKAELEKVREQVQNVE